MDSRDGDQPGLDRLTARIIGCAFTVMNTLGVGFLERVYENALAHEMRKHGLSVEQNRRSVVLYDGVAVGEYVTDLLVEDRVIVELKVAAALHEQHVAQCVNYVRATGKPVCLLFNFGRPRLEVRRIVGPG
jgi:GxxExxY protein